MNVSNALRWPVSSPWRLRRYGNPTAYLSSRQRSLLMYLAATGRTRGRRTLEEMSRVVGVTSRGQLSRELRRLRQLELIGYRTRRGQLGWHSIWIDRRAAKLRALRRAVRAANDSLSTPFGGFISRSGVEKANRGSIGSPPGAGSDAGVGPRRGHDPPRVLYAHCPAGHTARLPRGPWMRASSGQLLKAEWRGVCRKCGDRPIVEIVQLELAPVEPRGLSPEELRDPSVLERRRRMAALFAAEGHRLDEQTIRFYADAGGPDAADPPDREDRRPLGSGITETLRRVAPRPDGRPKGRPDDR